MPILMEKYSKKIAFLLIDSLVVQVSLFFAIFVRMDFNWTRSNPFFERLIPEYNLLAFVVFIISFWLTKNHRVIVRLSNLHTALRVSIAVLLGSLVFYGLSLTLGFDAMPRSMYFLSALTTTIGCVGYRFYFRILSLFDTIGPRAKGKRSLIYGAGLTTERLLPVVIGQRGDVLPVGIIDDNPKKRGCEIQGVKVLGGFEVLAKTIAEKEVDRLILSIGTPEDDLIRKILAEIEPFELELSVFPKIDSVLGGSKVDLRSLKLEDLLRRSPINLDVEKVAGLLKNKEILVTGGGGSIGSELVRQIALFSPRKILVIESSELALYRISEEMARDCPHIEFVPIMGDVSREEIMDRALEGSDVEVIFHACAYKHVHLSEQNPGTTIYNNIKGAYCVFEKAVNAKVPKVVLISTDKAVNCATVMGATKRICELLTLYFQSQSGGATIFSAVRFGNVLGSSGSVVPKFIEQIEKGGPITVTHPDMTRYFMLIPEAAKLVLQASTSSLGGEIFLLNMGTPVKIRQLAEDMIRLSGLRVGKDIKIEYVGLKPGEKIDEELNSASEKLITLSEDLFRLDLGRFQLDSSFHENVLQLVSESVRPDRDHLRNQLFQIAQNSLKLKKGTVSELKQASVSSS